MQSEEYDMVSKDVEVGGRRGISQKRFVRTLSVRNKMWLNIGILMVPLMALAVVYLRDTAHTLGDASKELSGIELYDPVTEVTLSTSRREELAARALGHKLGPASESLQAVDAEVDKAMAWLHKADAEFGSAKSHANLADVDRALQGARNSQAGSLDDALKIHERVLDAAFAYRDRVGIDFNLALDPDLSTYPLIDVSMNRFPELNREVTVVRGNLMSFLEGGRNTEAKALAVESALGVIQDRINAANADLDNAQEGLAGRPELLAKLQTASKNWQAPVVAWLELAKVHLDDGQLSADDAIDLIQKSESLPKTIMETQDAVQDVTREALTGRVNGQKHALIIFTSCAAIAIVLSLFLIMALSIRIAGAISRMLVLSKEIASGNFENRIDRSGEDEISGLFCGLDDMQKRLAEERERERAAVERERQTVIINERVRQGLDSVDTCVMIADEKNNIIFINKRFVQVLGAAQHDIRKSLPQFDVAKLVGTNMDAFHRSPAHQRSMVEQMKGSHVVTLDFAGHVFRLTATPVAAVDGTRLGTVVEWLDRSQEVRIEKEVSGIVAAVIDGDLSQRIALEGKTGFFESLSKGINGLVDNVTEMVAKVQGAANEVHRGASEISTGNANLAQRTEEQASSLEETASSMEQMTSTVKQNADNAGQANQLAVAARDQADKGGAVVARAVKAMGDINTSSKKIADIIGVIDEIAFQTNLLALNAAVEAARAGEQGRGFAVVASEVRSLAGRSASAAKEIKELIQDSVRKVDEGSALVTQSGATLDQIVSAVKKVGDIVAEIAAASQEQSAGIEQVNKAVMQLDELTQQNAALVEQATAASQSMADQAQGLNEVMSRYHLGGAHAGTAAPAGRATAAGAAPKQERRAGNRPWGNRAKEAQPAAAAQAPRRPAAAASSESEWNEF
jgi:methyl-accepting chemotaxis protein